MLTCQPVQNLSVINLEESSSFDSTPSNMNLERGSLHVSQACCKTVLLTGLNKQTIFLPQEGVGGRKNLSVDHLPVVIRDLICFQCSCTLSSFVSAKAIPYVISDRFTKPPGNLDFGGKEKGKKKYRQFRETRERVAEGKKKRIKAINCSASNWFIFNELTPILNQKSYS